MHALAAPRERDPIDGILRGVAQDLGYVLETISEPSWEMLVRSACRRVEVAIALLQIAERRRGGDMPFVPPEPGVPVSSTEGGDMPYEPPLPLVTASFLDEIARCTWREDRLVDARGTPRYLTVVERAWALGSSGHLLSESTYRTLLGARANRDGSFIDAAGVTRRLSDRFATT